MAFPLVPGLTETAPDGASMMTRLSDVLSQRPGNGREKIADAVGLLHDAARVEGDPKIRAHITAALGMLLGTSEDDESDDDTMKDY